MTNSENWCCFVWKRHGLKGHWTYDSRRGGTVGLWGQRVRERLKNSTVSDYLKPNFLETSCLALCSQPPAKTDDSPSKPLTQGYLRGGANIYLRVFSPAWKRHQCPLWRPQMEKSKFYHIVHKGKEILSRQSYWCENENLHAWLTAPPGQTQTLPAPPISSEMFPISQRPGRWLSFISKSRVCPYSNDRTGLSPQRQDAIAGSWPVHNTININVVRLVEALEELSPTSILMVLPYIGVEAAV